MQRINAVVLGLLASLGSQAFAASVSAECARKMLGEVPILWDAQPHSGTFEDWARTLGLSRHGAESLLTHPDSADDFRHVLLLAEWIQSEEGRKINERTAELIDADRRRIAQERSEQLEAALDLPYLVESHLAGRADQILLDQMKLQQTPITPRKQIRVDRPKLEPIVPSATPVQFFTRAIKESASGFSLANKDFAPLLMGDYDVPAIAIADIDNLEAYLSRLSDPKWGRYQATVAALELTRRIEADYEFYFSLAPVTKALAANGFAYEGYRGVIIIPYILQFIQSGLRQTVFTKMRSRLDIDAIFAGTLLGRLALDAPGCSSEQYLQFVGIGRKIFDRFYDFYLPAMHEPITGQTIESHQLNTLKRIAQALRTQIEQPANTRFVPTGKSTGERLDSGKKGAREERMRQHEFQKTIDERNRRNQEIVDAALGRASNAAVPAQRPQAHLPSSR